MSSDRKHHATGLAKTHLPRRTKDGPRKITRRVALRRLTSGVAWLALAPSTFAKPTTQVPGPVTAVRRHRGKPSFFLDGKLYTKPIFETYVPEVKFFRKFAEAGTDVFCFSTNLGPGFSAPTWLGPDRWDFQTLDTLAHRVLDANHRGLLLPRIYLTTPEWWVKANPEECQMLANGAHHYSKEVGMQRGGQSYPSVVSAKWRTDTAAALQRVIRHMQQADYAKFVFGYVVTGLMSEEWYHWSIHTNELSDYSAHATRTFREWLRAKYQTPETLQRAWNVPGVDFSTVAVPSQDARQRGRNERTFRDPTTEMPVIDWYLFYNDIIPGTIDHFCHAAKKACEFKKVVGAFYCYMFEFGGDPEFGHNALAQLLQSPNLDFALVTASYHDRALGRGADYARAPITSLSLHGKLWYHDNDTVSFRYDQMNRSNQDRGTVERYRRELGVTETPQETLWQYRRGAGFVLGNGVYQSFFDLHGGYFDDPELMAEVKRLNRLLEDSANYDCSSVAEILVVTDEASCSYMAFESGFMQQTLQPAQLQLAKLGAPHDSILVDDLVLADLKRYKLIIFLNCFHLTDVQREFIRRKVLNRNRTVVWCYAPGFFNGSRASIEAVRELTGLQVERAERADRVRLRIELNDSGLAFMEKRVQPASTNASSPAVRQTETRVPEKTIVGHEHVWAQLFFIDDPKATALGHIEGRREVGLALKSMQKWTSVYTANPVLPSALLRALSRSAGVHVYCDLDDTLYASRCFLTLAADKAGRRVVILPRCCNVFDPFSGARLWRGVDQFERDFLAKEVVIWRLEQV